MTETEALTGMKSATQLKYNLAVALIQQRKDEMKGLIRAADIFIETVAEEAKKIDSNPDDRFGALRAMQIELMSQIDVCVVRVSGFVDELSPMLAQLQSSTKKREPIKSAKKKAPAKAKKSSAPRAKKTSAPNRKSK